MSGQYQVSTNFLLLIAILFSPLANGFFNAQEGTKTVNLFQSVANSALQFDSPANISFTLTLQEHIELVLALIPQLDIFELENPVVQNIIKDTEYYDGHRNISYTIQNIRAKIQTLLIDPTNSFPVTRRFISAFLIRIYLIDSNWSESQIHEIISLCGELFLLHRSGYVARHHTEFFHISKAGGTSICQLGAKNGCTSQSFSIKRNCLIDEFSDGPRWTCPKALASLGAPWCARWGMDKQYFSCQKRLSFMERRRINFYANEYVMHTPNRSILRPRPCPGINTFILFREPRSRMLSHMRQILEVYTSQFGDKLFSHFNPFLGKSWKKLAPAVVDNYYTRTLLGEVVYQKKFGSMKEQHVEIAKTVILQLDVVVVLERSHLYEMLFKMGLGWAHSLIDTHARNGSESKAMKFGKVRKLGRVHVSDLFAKNELDDRVYEYANFVQTLDAFIYSITRLGYQLRLTDVRAEGYGTFCGFGRGWFG